MTSCFSLVSSEFKLSNLQTWFSPVMTSSAAHRPSGDGTAHNTCRLGSLCKRTNAIPFRSRYKITHVPWQLTLAINKPRSSPLGNAPPRHRPIFPHHVPFCAACQPALAPGFPLPRHATGIRSHNEGARLWLLFCSLCLRILLLFTSGQCYSAYAFVALVSPLRL
jgi:hypothetical protein